MASAWLGLGTNLGDRRENLARALEALAGLGTLDAISSVYESEPVGFREQPPFWNLVIRLRTELPPAELLTMAKAIEHAMGRRPSFRNAPRVIDIDLLLYDDDLLSTPSLTIPHPRLTERAFVLRPLTEIDPELRRPGSGEPFSDYLRNDTLEETTTLFPGTELLA
jgi:2-amino-4-hydroxy-6-hydroxymethyldihydropteridine diphosphokinase